MNTYNPIHNTAKYPGRSAPACAPGTASAHPETPGLPCAPEATSHRLLEDGQIIELYWNRAEAAISATAAKYSRFLHAISLRIVRNPEDADECVNDTYLRTWNSIPPTRPQVLKAYLGTIVRNLSLDCYNRRFAARRQAGEFTLLLSELEECIPASKTLEEAYEDQEIADSISHFLQKLSAEKQKIFIRRYYYCEDIKEIAARYGYSESKVKSALFDTRKKLKKYLEKEGIYI